MIFPMKRKPKTDAERARAYRLRHRLVKSVSLSTLDGLREEMIRRKAKIAASGAVKRPADALLKVLELCNWVERELAALRPNQKG